MSDDEEDDVLLSLTGFETTDGLEDEISKALGVVASGQVTIVEVEEDQVLFVVFGIQANDVVEKLNSYNSYGWKCMLAEMEEEVSVEEDEAYELWQNMTEDSRTCHLQAVPSPDGELIQPKHDDGGEQEKNAIDAQRIRDPLLMELDNVTRIKCSNLDQEATKWEEPFVITDCCCMEDPSLLMTREQLVERLGDVQVRTGNRNTLIESGFDNSTPLELSKAMETNGCVVFTPTRELPSEFQNDLEPLVSRFPPFQDKKQGEQKKYTLCVANQAGFGIGMHKHNAAFFLLVQGRKKWYMSSSAASELTDPTHPGFYTTKSTHKCIQKPGEILYVPNQWYHEIFNLEYTAGFQALPDE